MSTELRDIPESIIAYLREASATFGLANDEETMEKLTESWLEKKEAFEEKMIDMGMDEIGSLDQGDERAILALTYSGSLISIGPIMDENRNVEYTSIGLRNDVPKSLTIDNTNLLSDIEVGKSIEFENCPIKNTSPVFKIVACPEELSVNEQEDMLKEAATVIVDTFVGLNKELLEDME